MVRYQKVSAYANGNVSALAETLGWKAVTSGANVSLLIPYDDGVFYDAKNVDEIAIVLLVQTYLDLQSILGGYQVIKKWLSYRENKILERDITVAEAREVTAMTRRIAALIALEKTLDENYERVK
jgi:hypothetical protein